VTCDRCPEYEARIEALLDELHDLNVAACREAAIDDAQARHPSNDDCPPHGIERPRLSLVKIGVERTVPHALASSASVPAVEQSATAHAAAPVGTEAPST
jgi:hypothetical protein